MSTRYQDALSRRLFEVIDEIGDLEEHRLKLDLDIKRLEAEKRQINEARDQARHLDYLEQLTAKP
jgi:hypothetical protein